jgi:hypothetical protein
MPKRDRGKPQSRESGPRRSRATRRTAGRRPARTRGAVLLLLMLALAAFVAPPGQASAAGERSSAEQEALSAARTAEREARTDAAQAQRESEKAARKAQREADLAAARAKRAAERAAKKAKLAAERADKRHNDNLHGEVRFHCTSVEWTFMNFPEADGNTVVQELTFNHEVTKRAKYTFSFDGPTSVMTIPIDGPPGHYMIDAWARWDTNGLRGNFDIRGSVTCAAVPAFSIEKLQKIAGATGSYTTSTLSGQLGQTVDYEIVVRNTGNVALTLGSFSDERCDAGTVLGGPVGGILAAGASTNYTCSHLLDVADQAAGSYSNAVTLTGTPPEGDGAPIAQGSNTVVVEVAPAGSDDNGGGEEHHEPTPGGNSTTSNSSSSSSNASSGVLSSTVNQSQSGVLAFASASVPALTGPEGCVRKSFHVSIRSAGVQSVTFYLDGHKLKTLTAKNARKGLLTIEMNPAKLKVGAHKLVARITMMHSASTKATVASRKVTILRCHSAVVTPKFTG